MDDIDALMKIKDSPNFVNKYKQLKDKVKKYRQTGLDNGGEYSTENLVFKLLRNNGYLGKLMNSKNIYLIKDLSLTETV